MNKTIVLLLTALALSTSAATARAGEGNVYQRAIADFEDEAPLENWEARSFKGETRYDIAREEGNNFLRATAEGTASAIANKTRFDPGECQTITWRWKIDTTVSGGDATKKDKDDYAARVYIVFPSWWPPSTRTVNYIWANKLKEGEQTTSTYTDNAVMIAVDSGNGKAGQWVEHSRNIRDDFEKAFGMKLPGEAVVAIMTDTDQTGEKAVGYYDDIRLECTAKP